MSKMWQISWRRLKWWNSWNLTSTSSDFTAHALKAVSLQVAMRTCHENLDSYWGTKITSKFYCVVVVLLRTLLSNLVKSIVNWLVLDRWYFYRRFWELTSDKLHFDKILTYLHSYGEVLLQMYQNNSRLKNEMTERVFLFASLLWVT